MSNKVISNAELTELKKRINKEIKRRATFSWWDPLATPSVGVDKKPPLNIPDKNTVVDDNTYTINNPSEGSIERTRNIVRPVHGTNPGGEDYSFNGNAPTNSAGRWDVDEVKNFIVGLAKINDINLYYGRDEQPGVAFRDIDNVKTSLENAEHDVLHRAVPFVTNIYLVNDELVVEYEGEETFNVSISESGDLIIRYDEGSKYETVSTIKFYIDDNGDLIVEDVENVMYLKNDPSTDTVVPVPHENGMYMIPSGEYEGEEMYTPAGLGPKNFFDDYGAEPGDGDYHPFNAAKVPITRRYVRTHDNGRRLVTEIKKYGGMNASTFGQNPRNPHVGDEYDSIPAYIGGHSSCENACTGLCSISCDDMCSESCTSTCYSRCGNGCSASCGNACTGCSTLCYSSCKTKCENITGYSCLKAGAKTVKISSTGGTNGVPAKNTIEYTTHSCDACSYSCQFYPNKKTECWDAGCMSKCFTSCNSACSDTCVGGCIDNASENTGEYKIGKGRGCSGNCTINCVGLCRGACEGMCTQSCWATCKQSCSDNCTVDCTTNCGSNCSSGCSDKCTSCTEECTTNCKGAADTMVCTGCSSQACTSACKVDCNGNCLGIGCTALCGTESSGACDYNCRINCTGSSCTSKCEDICSAQCSSCVNSCGFQCGACTSNCATGCESDCGLECTATCEHSCESNCVQSCSEECAGCSNLCYSCTGMCIGICSIKCQNGCSSCDTMCGWWCDNACSQRCFSNCDDMCLNGCMNSCITYATSDTTNTSGPDRAPTAEGYDNPNPSNRLEEQDSFKIRKD